VFCWGISVADTTITNSDVGFRAFNSLSIIDVSLVAMAGSGITQLAEVGLGVFFKQRALE
jgi:hypothetical protein